MNDPSSAPPAPPKTSSSGIHAALRFTGIPVSWLSKRPKLPSRNWLIFIGATSTLVGLYAYDRKQCRDIRDAYVKRVEHLAQEPMTSMELPRKVTVLSCKWPGDEDWKRGQTFFKKYIKPILVAAAVDYELESGRRHGDLARKIADKIHARRRADAGLETPSGSLMPTPVKRTQEQKDAKELSGGSIIVGRAAFKEYMEGLRRGWTSPPVRVDREEALARILSEDGRFDEPEPMDSTFDVDGDPIPTKSRLAPSSSVAQAFSPLQQDVSRSPSSPSTTDAASIPAPDTIPPQPPLLLVPFTNHIGLRQIPLMIAEFFYQRAKVAAGAEAAYRLVMGRTRPLLAPGSEGFSAPLFSPDETAPETDLDFDRKSESYYPPSTTEFVRNIEKSREEYYNTLPAKLATARALARGERELTKEEQNHPPPTEVDLRAERLKKEMRWQNDEEGWKIVKPEAAVAWDERFRNSLQVFIDPQ